MAKKLIYCLIGVMIAGMIAGLVAGRLELDIGAPNESAADCKN